MGKSFTISPSENIDSLLKRVKEDTSKGNVKFEGDANQGSFSGSGVEGRYDVKDNKITIYIDKKPFIAPWGMVEDKIREYFS